MKLRGKTAFITGATGTIGRTIAQAFAHEGCNLILCGLSTKKIRVLKKEFASSRFAKITVIRADVSNKKSLQQLFKEVAKGFKTIDILVTAAGTYGAIGTLEQTEPEEWMEAIMVNLLGTFMAIKYALPLLKKSPRAKIITFAGGGEGALQRHSSYVASKGGVLRLVETVSREFPFFDINAISPGLVVSGLVDEIIKAGPELSGKERYEEALRQKSSEIETVSPEKAASLAVFLASSDSNGISGKNISAVWDKWRELPKHTKEIMKSDVYNIRRIKPKDRGYDW